MTRAITASTQEGAHWHRAALQGCQRQPLAQLLHLVESALNLPQPEHKRGERHHPAGAKFGLMQLSAVVASAREFELPPQGIGVHVAH